MSNKDGYTGGESWDDWDDVDTEPPPPIPKGTIVRAKFTSTEVQTAKSGNPMIKVALECEEDYAGDVDVEQFQRNINREFLVFIKTNRWKIKSVAESAEVALPGGSMAEHLREFAADLLGSTCLIQVAHERSQNGRVYLAVGRFLTQEQADKILNPEADSGEAEEAETGGRRGRRAS